MKETFGEYIHKLRVDNGLTLTKLAAALDIDQSTLSKIENGKRNVPSEIIPKLSSFFNLDLKRLEHEYLSERIAELIYPQEETKKLFLAAEEKAKYSIDTTTLGSMKARLERLRTERDTFLTNIDTALDVANVTVLVVL